MLVCAHCGKDIGFVGAVQRSVVDETEQRILAGSAARCPVCQQAVELKSRADKKSFVPHYGLTQAKICPGSGKPLLVVSAPLKLTSSGKDLSAHLTRDVIKVIQCRKNGATTIEVLTLEYLDKSERVRIQIEALREMLGPGFRMRDYPPTFGKAHLGVWSSSEACVVAAKHPQGGYQSIADTEVAAVLTDLRQKELFFG
jgi:hypothetical protein